MTELHPVWSPLLAPIFVRLFATLASARSRSSSAMLPSLWDGTDPVPGVWRADPASISGRGGGSQEASDEPTGHCRPPGPAV